MRIITFCPSLSRGLSYSKAYQHDQFGDWSAGALRLLPRYLHSQPREISSCSLPSPAIYSQHTQRTQRRCGAQVTRFNTPYRKSSRYTTRTRDSLSLSCDLIRQADLENYRDQI